MILVTSWPDQASCAELEGLTVGGEWPQTDYTELAHVLGTDMIDRHYMVRRQRWNDGTKRSRTHQAL